MHLIFSERGCFRRKIMTQSNRFELTSSFQENEVAIGKDRGHMFAIQRKKEKERFFFRLFTILVKHVEFGARLSNPRWFVCERYFLTSLLSYNWLSIKPAYSLQQCMAKQFARSIRSFDKFQEKEAYSGILLEGISQNIILRVFLKLQETLK